MTLFLMILALMGDPATCPMHAQHMAEAAAKTAATSHHAHGVDQRGDAVMGFSHQTTRHHFRLFSDGGAIEVQAIDSADAATIAIIREHLRIIAADFSKGDFTKPETIHARVPDGVPALQSMQSAIRYEYEELPAGARVRIRAEESGRDAVHAFLRFQIRDHRTGDSELIGEDRAM
jgi:hypothetical protein